MPKIVVTGPESSGKTTLANALAQALGTGCSPEFARFYLPHLGRDYRRSDLQRIAAGQMAWEDWYAALTAPAPLVCDTDMTVLHIWHLYKYGVVEPSIAAHAARRRADFYLLTAPDFDWQPDPLREHPNERWQLFSLYESLLRNLGARFEVLRGGARERLEFALEILQREMGGTDKRRVR